MKKYSLLNTLLYSFILSLIMMSCTENAFITVVDVDTAGHRSKLAVTARFIKDSPSDKGPQYIYLAASKGINDLADIKQVPNAEVTIWEGEQKVDEGIYVDSIPSLYFTEKKVSGYRMDWEGYQPGHTYTLKVKAEGFEPVSATIVMPDKSVINSVQYISQGFTDPDGGEKLDEIVVGMDNLEKGKYYLAELDYVQFDKNGTKLDSAVSSEYLQPEGPLYHRTTNGGLLFRGEDILGLSNKEIRLAKGQGPIDLVHPNNYYQLHLYNITKDQYAFILSVEQYDNIGENPFVEPVVVYSNIENGFGIFSLEYHQTIKIKP